ncbi:MAG: helix-hairpin-helix domain-containing protein [Candidatus Omnitrophota bacterium]|nr:helix-hairpin-helix domain-containing protein [Candidatus Omnitrophota bacterium]
MCSLKEGFFMLNLTPQERRVILFLTSVALLGLGINCALKVNSRITKLIQVDNRIAKININKANLEDLLSVPGITPKLAKNIVAYRNTNGAFRDIEELKDIKGIGDYRYEKLKDLFFMD